MATDYVMEDPDEVIRLDTKTDPEAVKKQALWAGIRPGMRIADLGCGSGKTTRILSELVQPGGSAVGIDFSMNRIEFAKGRYAGDATSFECRDVREPMDGLGHFDFIWIRFLLEYYLSGAFEIVSNVSKLLKPGGTLLLIDIDYNCLTHFGIPQRLEKTILRVMETLQKKANFDPYAGRKLYSFLYDLGYEDIAVDILPHNLFYGELKDADAYNTLKKAETIMKKGMIDFGEYEGGYQEFMKEYIECTSNPRRFYYSPLICCRGRRPLKWAQ